MFMASQGSEVSFYHKGSFWCHFKNPPKRWVHFGIMVKSSVLEGIDYFDTF